MLIFLFSLTTMTFAKDNPDFTKDARGVMWKTHKIKNADPATFDAACPQEYLDHKGDALFCAVDAKHIFIGRDKNPEPGKEKIEIEDYDRLPVKELGKNHFQIGKTVFFKDFTHEMQNADFATFNELEEENESGIDSRRQWASDHHAVYCAGEVVTGLSPRDLAFWPFLSWDCRDLVSTQIGNTLPSTGYIKDRGGVFIYMDCKLHMRLPDADAATFTVPNILFPSRARDGKGHFYNCGNMTMKKKWARAEEPPPAP